MSSTQDMNRRVRPDGAAATRTVLILVVLLLVLVSVGLVVASPWALRALDRNGDAINWNRLSEIGATYGAVSAIIVAIALLGVVAALVIQSREAKAARKNAQRAHHVDLLRLAMDDPSYMECWGPYLTESFDTERQYTYVNLIVTQWNSEYEIGEMTDVLLRATAVSVFASSPGRQYWATSGSFWRDNTLNL
jgi:ABC-type multidrug transport system fused ATPase/permease subunit